MNGTLKIVSRVRDYEVAFEGDTGFLDGLASLPQSVCVADSKVWGLYENLLAQRFKDRAFLVNATEDNKTLDGAQDLYRFLCGRTAKRNLKLVAVGGGILQDLAGFAASTLFRGVEWHYVPTTLLAQADSCIGGKTSLNFDGHKNLLGSFFPPKRVHIHTAFLDTLSLRDFHSGLGEIIKLQLMKEGPKDLDGLKRSLAAAPTDRDVLLGLIRGSLEVKVSYMESDEFDQGRRNLLNFGHCFGHALETASNYGLPHGLAVTVGMVFANLLAVRRGRMSEVLATRLNKELLLPNLPGPVPKFAFNAPRLLTAMKSDKKVTSSHLSVVVADEALAFHKLDDVTDEEFHGTLDALLKLFV